MITLKDSFVELLKTRKGFEHQLPVKSCGLCKFMKYDNKEAICRLEKDKEYPVREWWKCDEWRYFC